MITKIVPAIVIVTVICLTGFSLPQFVKASCEGVVHGLEHSHQVFASSEQEYVAVCYNVDCNRYRDHLYVGNNDMAKKTARTHNANSNIGCNAVVEKWN